MNHVPHPPEPINCHNFIGGSWTAGNGAAIEITSPYSGAVIGKTHASTRADIDQAVAGAVEGFAAWSAKPLKERCQTMFRFRELLLRDKQSIAARISLENGKTVGESLAGLMKGIEVLEFALSIQNMDQGGRMEVSRGVFCEYRRQPLGVVLAISPFNFPAMVPMWMIPIALTVGNAFVWKPSEKTPLTAMLIADLLKEAGLPDGAMTVVQGGRETVEGLLDHAAIKAVGFVGSTAVAEAVYRRGCSNGKRVLALGGAKNHIILLPDADPEMAAVGISDSFTGCAGQRCMAASVLLAVGQVDGVIDKIVARAESQQLGQTMGAVISAEQIAFLCDAVDEAVAAGAVIRAGHNYRETQPVDELYRNGFWFPPVILDNVAPDSRAAREELFGPILSIVRCDTFSEAMAIENANPYGNAASIFTNNGAMGERLAKEAAAGMVGVNIGIPVPREPFSFGGINRSKFGHGDITGATSLDFWSDLKKVTVKWQMQTDHNWMS
ncbi:CoA-acylating methylmalonate-semialdehyde dehydrogenase [Acanthopleuribacter pedis]|uniref:CoA-acylating methylmalonate-semialdehyde dehydrogenase n=1 Tax=Acanthopleuribacter pedis TaxID=442870 RepID=A0A8J7QA54_9BACT|nr:CoA-acylating methylmalonate-semialdehyde dehydrogenase [Acanthopleuribacter pedis]MBO1320637.1 CoA-acylating methylmalonate-semialdehyde dehydrogenase [Acanthopleuribacter pedis]